MSIAALFVLSLSLGYSIIHSTNAEVEAETILNPKTTPNTAIHSKNSEEPRLMGLKPALPTKVNLPTSQQPTAKAAGQAKVIPPPVLPSADVTSAIKVNGMVPVFYKLKTEQPVVFLTIDDGTTKDPASIAFMAKHHLVATLFLNDSKIADNYPFFKTLQQAGNPIENHTVSHNDLTKLNYTQQKQEICTNADNFEKAYGKRPTLFRPPYGAFNDTTRRAAADCGMTALIHWRAKANGGSMQYQQGDKLMPGDIVLMHFRKEIIADLTAFTNAAEQANLRTVLLEDWIK